MFRLLRGVSYQRSEDKTPYWRTLKANGELNEKYPGGIEAQKEKLEVEGHMIVQKAGRISDTMLNIMKMPCLRYRCFGIKENKR